MQDKFFDMDEMMVDYAEMTSFDFKSGSYLEHQNIVENHKLNIFNFDVLDKFKSMFSKSGLQKN